MTFVLIEIDEGIKNTSDFPGENLKEVLNHIYSLVIV